MHAASTDTYSNTGLHNDTQFSPQVDDRTSRCGGAYGHCELNAYSRAPSNRHAWASCHGHPSATVYGDVYSYRSQGRGGVRCNRLTLPWT